jgi:hypothetical protein
VKSQRLSFWFVAAIAVAAAVVSTVGFHLQNAIVTVVMEEPRRPSRARLVRWHSPDLDSERERMFEQDLQGRCAVVSSLQADSRTWIVECSSRQRLRIVYDREGNLVQVLDDLQLVNSQDEPERHRLFDRELRGRCVTVSSRMESPGVWTVACSSGARHRFVFDQGILREISQPH